MRVSIFGIEYFLTLNPINMELCKVKNYIEHINYLISHECTGSADEFASKLGVSRRTLQNHLRQLRESGVNIEYNHFKRTYCYSNRGTLSFGFIPND
jgi:predicted ArsR family transcriptional regulator